MIFITGDLHGSIDIRKLLENNITDQMTENDYLIICGDFGLIWNYKKEIRKEKKWLKWLENRPWTTLFVDGNHECFPRLYAYPEKEWHGGKVHEIRPKILHLMRGEIFDIEGLSIFAMGGAASHDRGPAVGDTKAVIGKSWWPEEIPSEEERQNALKNLEKHHFEVDYIITHCLPTTYQDIVKRGKYPPDEASDFLEIINKKTTYKRWYSGHYHFDIDVTNKISVIFTRIIRIGEDIMNSQMMLGVPKYRKGDTVFYRVKDQNYMGVIKAVLPWGTFFKHEEPYYEIQPFDTTSKKDVVTAKESHILEKSLAENDIMNEKVMEE